MCAVSSSVQYSLEIFNPFTADLVLSLALTEAQVTALTRCYARADDPDMQAVDYPLEAVFLSARTADHTGGQPRENG